eukprot:gene307-396_t
MASYPKYKISYLKDCYIRSISKPNDPNHQLVGSINSLKIKISLWDLLFSQRLAIRYIAIDQGNFNLVKPKGAASFNAEICLLRLIAYFNSPSKSSAGIEQIDINQVVLNNLSLQVEDHNAPVMKGVDPKHCKIESITAQAHQVAYRQGCFTGHIQQLTAKVPASNLHLQQFRTQFSITSENMALRQAHLCTAESTFQGDLHFTYRGLELSNILSKMYVRGDIKELSLSTQELIRFVPHLKHHPTNYTLRGELIGNLEALQLQNFYLAFGHHPSHVSGNASFQNLSHLQQASFDVHLVSGEVYTGDLLPHIEKKYHSRLEGIKIHNLAHTLSGKLSAFTSQGAWETNIGHITTSLALGINEKAHKLSCKGDIKTQSLQLGQLLGIPKLQEVTMDAYIDGYGTSLEQIDFYIRTHITQLGCQGYRYQHIRADGNIGSFSFNGNLSIDDPHAVANFRTQVDWSLPTKALDLHGTITKLALDKLHFTPRLTHCSGDLHLTLQHASWDDFTTDITLSHIQLVGRATQPLYMEQLRFVNGKKDGLSNLSLHSDLLSIQMEGAIKYSDLVHDLTAFTKTYQQRLRHHPSYVPTYTEKPYNFTYYLHFKDINPLLQVVIPELHIAPSTRLQGFFSQQEEIQLELHITNADSLSFGQYHLQGSVCHLTALQSRDGSLIAATNIIRSKKQQWGDTFYTTNYQSDISWINDQITFKTSIGKDDSLLQVNLAGTANLNHPNIEVKFSNTDIHLAENTWTLHPAGILTLHPTSIRFHNILLSHGAQQISIEGQYTTNASKKLIVNLTKIDLGSTTSFLPQEAPIGGSLNGTVIIQKKPTGPHITSTLQVHGLTIDKLAAGNLHTKLTWNPSDHQITIACSLKQQQKTTIYLDGAYYTNQSKKHGMDLVAELAHAPLVLIKPLVNTIFGELNGRLDGTIYIKGQLQTPSLLGIVKVSDLKLKFNTLNALYKGKGTLICSKNNITVDKLKLTDDQNGHATITGKVTHHYLKDFYFDLQGNVDTLKILHAKYEDNHHFYGKGIVSGNIALTGMIDNLLLTARATTHKGSHLIIPIQKYSQTLGQESYIHFIDLKSCKKNGIKNLYVNDKPNRLNLNMTLEITPDAWAEILLNGKGGDTIQSKGKGLLTIKLDSESNLTMAGNYELIEGTYHFSAYEIVKRKFNILEGSTITWIDKPYDGILHVQAVHHQRAPLFPLLETHSTNSDHKKYPIDVLLSLEGTLAEPDLRFDIDFPKYPDNIDLQEAIYAFKDKIASDTNYLEKQVLSLIVLRTFFPSNLDNLREDALKRSVGEIFSQQLNSLAAQWDEHLGIDADINLEEFNQDKATNLPFRLSYNLLPGKLMIVRASKINFDKRIEMANMIGNWSIEYVLTADNKLRAKFHFSPSGAEINTGMSNISKPVFGGFSFVYVKNFNRWRELLFWKKKKQFSTSTQEK